MKITEILIFSSDRFCKCLLLENNSIFQQKYNCTYIWIFSKVAGSASKAV